MTRTELYKSSIDYFLRPIASLLNEGAVTEIMINGPDEIQVERKGRIVVTDLKFPGHAELNAAVRNIAEYNERFLDDLQLTMDGHLPDGSRIHVIMPPAAKDVHVTIRKFNKQSFSLEKLVDCESLTDVAAEFLDVCVKLHKNIVFSGGTGTGKTSMLNALSGCIPSSERVIVIEDTAELQLNDECHTISLEAQQGNGVDSPQVSIRELFANTLRMRPDRIIVGEVRRGEALDLVQSMISGHAGALTTVHANTPRDAAIRLETLCLMNDAELPVYVARQQVASAIHIVLQLVRVNGVRRVQSIAECCGLDSESERGQYAWRDLFQYESRGLNQDGTIDGELAPTGVKPSFATEPKSLGLESVVQKTSAIFV